MEETQAKSCIFNGNTYSHGATVCSNKSELICNDGSWEPTGKQCDQEEFKTASHIWGHVSQAMAFTDSNGAYQDKTEQVTIINGNIEVTFRQFGTAKIVSSMIENANHSQYLYYGINQVPPGTYTHRVGDGQGRNVVGYPPASSIESLLNHD